jgi:hypothetical protein
VPVELLDPEVAGADVRAHGGGMAKVSVKNRLDQLSG